MLATYCGLYIGSIKQKETDYCWSLSKVYFRDNLISHFYEIQKDQLMVADYSKPGYTIVDLKNCTTYTIEDTSESGHNSGCTSIEST